MEGFIRKPTIESINNSIKINKTDPTRRQKTTVGGICYYLLLLFAFLFKGCDHRLDDNEEAKQYGQDDPGPPA